MIDSKFVILVRALQDYGSISKAANHLNLTQSAISHQLRRAEEELGVLLFHRKSKGIEITEAGQAIYDYSLALIEENSVLDAKLNAYKKKTNDTYVHGYSAFESNRLNDQASSIAEFIHYDSIWAEGSRILEIGCGVGAQTKILASQNPRCHFTSIDLSEESVLTAKSDKDLQKLSNVDFHCLDVYDVGRLGLQFDHIFICFVLEHLGDPLRLLKFIRQFTKDGGTITVVEGDHGSAYFHPESRAATKAVNGQIKYQAQNGGNANIGRQLHFLLSKSSYEDVRISPRCIYV
ncbi:MAG: methyltransferase, partial [Bacteroidota bacterium]